MKTGILASPSIASPELEKSTMGMSAKGMDIASYFLRDKIYSNKILACIREYVCNAVDEHIKHNISRPVDVTLVDVDGELVWSVRDYAKGLSEHDVRNVFGMYFESTKSNTNTMIGGFGIGSKAGHCYTDTFYVKSHFEGVCTLYACVLGGGSKGVPVGEIFKISEENTNESGIEISLVVNRSDKNSFIHHSENIVTKFGKPKLLKFNLPESSVVIFPQTPDQVVDKNGFTFNLYKGDTAGKIEIRMGGVIYKSLSSPWGKNAVGNVIVDVPIGKLTIPISREYIEATPANDAVIANMWKSFDEIYNEEFEKLPKTSMGKFINGHNSRKDIALTWFKFEARNIYPNEDQLCRYLRNYLVPYGKSVSFDANGKIKVYVVHTTKRAIENKWLSRLHDHLQNPEGYTTIKEGYLQLFTDEAAKNNVDISDIEFIPIRKVGIPAIKRAPKDPNAVIRYAVYRENRKVGNFTAEELEEFVTKDTNKKITKNWWKSAKTIKELNDRTVTLKGPISNYTGYCIQSKVLYDKLLKLGWLDRFSNEYADQCNEIAKLQQARRKFEDAEYTIRNMFKTNINPKAVMRLTKNPKARDRFVKLLAKLNNENSTRSRILTTINAHYKILPRADYRAVMKLKNS